MKIGSERMTADRWRRIEQLYHAALERDPGERTAYVADVCRGDDDSRMEVESLLLARETMKAPCDAVDDQERKRQEALLKAAALLELNPDFPGARIQAHDEEKIIEDNAAEEIKELGSGPRLEHFLKILDARGRAYLRLVTSLESQKAFAKIMEDFGRQGWFQFSGIPIESVPPLSPSATLRPPLLLQRERFLERVDFWEMEGFRRLDSLRKNQTKSSYSNPTEAELGSIGRYTRELREERRITELAAQRVKRTYEAAVAPATPGLPPPGSGSSSPPPAANGEPDSAKRPASRLWTFAIVISVAVASFAAALYIYRPHNRIGNVPATRSKPLEAGASLWAERQGEDLKIMWDLDSPEVAGATSGVLDINDGGTAQQIPMTADQVRFGSLLYSPMSDRVSVRLTALKDNRSTKEESVLVLLREPAQPRSSEGQQAPHIPFEVKAERVASTPGSVPPAGNREIRPPVELKDHPIVQTRPARVEPPAPLQRASVRPPPASAAPRSEPAKTAIQASSARVDLPASPPPASALPPPASAAPRSEPAKTAIQTSSPRVDLPASPPLAAASPPPTSAAPRSEPAKTAIQASSARVDLPASPPLASALPPASAAPRSEPAKTATQTSSERVDLSAQLPRVSGPPPPTVAVPQSEPAKPQEESFVAPVLIAQEGVQTPRELLPILTRRVAVSVRVDVNEAGRVTRAEAIAEKGIHALLLRAATDAARRCRFQPARRGQSPVSSSVTIVFYIGPEK